jgi:hypothetical protein
MRRTKVLLIAGVLLALPIIGWVQQMPGEVKATQPATALAELQALVKTQTEAIQVLHTKVVELEARVEKLEQHKPGKDPQ